jgi:hypothetical protein
MIHLFFTLRERRQRKRCAEKARGKKCFVAVFFKGCFAGRVLFGGVEMVFFEVTFTFHLSR